MPSADLIRKFKSDLAVCDQWLWNGRHYQRTAEAWLKNLDDNSAAALDIMRSTYGRGQAARWLNRWRVFFLAVSELFGYAAGEEWQVAHYRLQPVSTTN
jgi:cyclopropane-fatty-acyl-phospholipid synthase